MKGRFQIGNKYLQETYAFTVEEGVIVLEFGRVLIGGGRLVGWDVESGWAGGVEGLVMLYVDLFFHNKFKEVALGCADIFLFWNIVIVVITPSLHLRGAPPQSYHCRVPRTANLFGIYPRHN